MRAPYFFLVLYALSLGLTSCEDQKDSPQIPESKLVNILADIHIAEAALQSLRGDTKDSVAHAYYQQIYEIHETDSVELHATLEAMRQQPERMRELYDQVMERVEKLNATSKSAEAEE